MVTNWFDTGEAGLTPCLYHQVRKRHINMQKVLTALDLRQNQCFHKRNVVTNN